MSSSRLHFRIRKRSNNEPNYCSEPLISFCGCVALILLFVGLIELYKSKPLATYQCQVISINVIHRDDLFHPRWSIKVEDQNRTTIELMIGSTGVPSENGAWSIAGKYKINETYSCYRSRNRGSDLSWAWQRKKPSKFTAYGLFVSGAVLLCLIMTLRILGGCRLVDGTDTRQQQEPQNELTTQLTDEEQQEPTAPPESPPPSYDEAIKHADRTETRI